jgi:hypothetical protein
LRRCSGQGKDQQHGNPRDSFNDYFRGIVLFDVFHIIQIHPNVLHFDASVGLIEMKLKGEPIWKKTAVFV